MSNPITKSNPIKLRGFFQAPEIDWEELRKTPIAYDLMVISILGVDPKTREKKSNLKPGSVVYLDVDKPEPFWFVRLWRWLFGSDEKEERKFN